MENINNSKSGFKVDSILLTESQFNRRGNINFKDSEQQNTNIVQTQVCTI